MKVKYSTRLVFVFKKIVIKIPICRKGFLQGYNEMKIWDKYKDIAPLAELKWMCLGVVCQKKYDSDLLIFPQIEVYNIKKLIPEFDFDNCDLYNPQNWGLEGNKYILLDYGINEHISKLY